MARLAFLSLPNEAQIVKVKRPKLSSSIEKTTAGEEPPASVPKLGPGRQSADHPVRCEKETSPSCNLERG